MVKFIITFIIYVLVTALPLLVSKLYSYDVLLVIMVEAEFLLATFCYFFYFRNVTGFSLRIHISKNILHLFVSYIIIIIALQFIAFIKIQQKKPSLPTNFSVLLTMILVIATPIYEEFFYRGCFFSGLLLLLKNKIIAVIITSIIFCAMHTQYNDFIDFFVLFISSLLMNDMRLKTNGLIYPIILHSIMNLAFIIINMQILYR